MRFYQKIETLLSEDEVSIPKVVRFHETREITESGTNTLMKDGGGRTETISTATVDYELAMGKIVAGKWFYFYADNDFDLKIDSGANLRVLKDHPTSVHMNFASLKVSTVGAAALRLTWAVSGD